MKDWIAIFRTGAHTDSNGNEKTWTEKELDTIVEKYNPKEHEAPVVIGHPKDNAPAYGWIEAVKREGDILYAKMKGLIPEFVEMVKKGMFKKRSISLYPDGTLRHIGFLGAMPPAVKGLPDFAFGDKGGLTIEFEENQTEKGGTMIEKMKKMLSDMIAMLSSGEEGGSQVTEKEIQDKIDAGIAAEIKKKDAEFSEKVASLDEQRKKKDAEFKAREDALTAKEAEGKKAAVASFCEDLKKKGILIPAMEKLGMGITEFMSQTSSIETTIEFGEEGKKEKQTPLEFMQAFLAALPKAI
ncbi:MAG: hypothetical protein Q8M92_08405, partial [Candidatus Subteraquimicrobiales bacterium]|nr:hypothetical protein [Candidatus Subteraquimicrobiales bacterium]